MATSIIRFINIIIAGLLAGVSFGIWIGFNPLNLSPSTYVEQQHNMLRAEQTVLIEKQSDSLIFFGMELFFLALIVGVIAPLLVTQDFRFLKLR